MPLTLLTQVPSRLGPLRYTLVETSWATMALLCRGDLVVRLLWADDPALSVRQQLLQAYPDARAAKSLLPELRQALANYFGGRAVRFHCRVDISWAGTFARQVLHQCDRIPLGQTVTYGELARVAGRPGAARAVGRVMAANPVPVLIPCHRVIRADGLAGGYSGPGGREMKTRLLALEATMIGREAAVIGT